MFSFFYILLTLIEIKLPIINNIYKSKFIIPLLGKQNIEYKRIEKYKSSLKLYGIINADGYLFFDKNDIKNYSFDEEIQNIMNKYKCKISEAYYNDIKDEIFLNVKVNPLNLQKVIILKNIYYEEKDL